MRKAFPVNGNLVSRSVSPRAILNNFESFSIITAYPYARSNNLLVSVTRIGQDRGQLQTILIGELGRFSK